MGFVIRWNEVVVSLTRAKAKRAVSARKYRFMCNLKNLDLPMAKILEYEATDIVIGDSRLLNLGWKILALGKKGERLVGECKKWDFGPRSVNEMKHSVALLEHWSLALKDIMEIRRGERMPYFPLFETVILNDRPILTTEDKINQAFRDAQREERVYDPGRYGERGERNE